MSTACTLMIAGTAHGAKVQTFLLALAKADIHQFCPSDTMDERLALLLEWRNAKGVLRIPVHPSAHSSILHDKLWAALCDLGLAFVWQHNSAQGHHGERHSVYDPSTQDVHTYTTDHDGHPLIRMDRAHDRTYVERIAQAHALAQTVQTTPLGLGWTAHEALASLPVHTPKPL